MDYTGRLSNFIEALIAKCQKKPMTLGEFAHELSHFGHSFLCLVLAVPFLLPFPLPGLSTALGGIICLAALQIAMAKDPWMPQFMRSREMPTSLIVKILEALLKIIQKTEHLIRPRMHFIAKHPGFVRVNGAITLILGSLLSLPMPPGFNAPPAIAIIVLSLGTLEHDGLWVIAGYVLSILNLILFTTFFVVGFEGLKFLIGF